MMSIRRVMAPALAAAVVLGVAAPVAGASTPTYPNFAIPSSTFSFPSLPT